MYIFYNGRSLNHMGQFQWVLSQLFLATNPEGDDFGWMKSEWYFTKLENSKHRIVNHQLQLGYGLRKVRKKTFPSQNIFKYPAMAGGHLHELLKGTSGSGPSSTGWSQSSTDLKQLQVKCLVGRILKYIYSWKLHIQRHVKGKLGTMSNKNS